MNKYEIMFIAKATQESSEVAATADAMKAYPIKKEINGYYFVMQVEATHEAVSEFNRKALLDERVLRHLIIKLDEE